MHASEHVATCTDINVNKQMLCKQVINYSLTIQVPRYKDISILSDSHTERHSKLVCLTPTGLFTFCGEVIRDNNC